MKKIKQMSKFLYIVFIIFLVIIGLLLSVSLIDIPGNFKVYTVQSGSMEPAIHVGSVVFVKPQTNYQKGDIIAFGTDPKTTTTHRINNIISTDDQKMFETKGDANDSPDSTLIQLSLVIGKVLLSIPLLGFLIAFARTQNGLIFLIIIPATIIIYSEILNIKNELVSIVRSKKKDETNDT